MILDRRRVTQRSCRATPVFEPAVQKRTDARVALCRCPWTMPLLIFGRCRCSSFVGCPVQPPQARSRVSRLPLTSSLRGTAVVRMNNGAVPVDGRHSNLEPEVTPTMSR
jgi:hypothetical protein